MHINDSVTGKTRLVGLIGNPIEHTISPQLHNTLSSILNVDLIYVPMKVEKEKLEDAIKGLKAIGFAGFNVTVPYKKDVMKYIDDNTKEALLMGAVNTVKYIDGRFYGYNTDAEGFSRSFKEEMGTGFKNKKVFILGAGGAARAISVKIAMEGAEKIYILNRTKSKASDLGSIINDNINNVVENCDADAEDSVGKFEQCEIVINTTSAGMHPEIENSPLPREFVFKKEQMVYDIIYNPSKTMLYKAAESSGCKVSNGLGMLFYQAIFAYEIWTGIKIPENVVKEVFTAFKKLLL